MSEKSYWFDVREVTIRQAEVRADSAAEARALLDRWADTQDPEGGALADEFDDRSRIRLDDLDTVSLTYRNIKAPTGSAY